MLSEISKAKKLYRTVFKIELIILLCGVLGVSVFVSEVWGSVLLGTIVGIVPHIAFMLFVLNKSQKVNLNKKAAVLYQGEGIKWLLTILGCLLVFKLGEINVLAFFIAFILTLLLNALLPILVRVQ